MAELRVEDARLTSDFAAVLAAQGAPAPWDTEDDNPGVLLTANGECVLTIDADRNLPDEVVSAIASAVIVAVNTCAGFKAVARG